MSTFTSVSVRRLFQILALLALFAMILSPVGAFQVSAQSSAPTVSTYAELPLKGQLIIPPGAEFVVPDEWHGLVVTVWRGMADQSIGPVVEFGNSIGQDRIPRYGPGPYETVIWDAVANPLPGFTGRTACDEEFDADGVALGKGTSIGDRGCFEMIEYDQSGQPVSAESLENPRNELEGTPRDVTPPELANENGNQTDPIWPRWMTGYDMPLLQQVMGWLFGSCLTLLFSALVAWASYRTITARHGRTAGFLTAALAFLLSFTWCLGFLILIGMFFYSIIRPLPRYAYVEQTVAARPAQEPVQPVPPAA